MNVFVGMKDGEDRYGLTSGTLRLIYEDAGGQEYEQETGIVTSIRELVIGTSADDGQEEAAERASQWWISLLIGGVVIVVLAAVLIGKKRVK